jgi:uncharacterized membrane protein YvlD (DUF360 family)
MKTLLRIYMVELFGLYVANSIASGLEFQNQLPGFLVTAGALAVASIVVRPIINILILPITLATMGLLKFLGHAIMLYVVDLALNQFSVAYFNFPGLHSVYLDLPSIQFGHGVMAYIAFSFVISFVTGSVNWLIKH